MYKLFHNGKYALLRLRTDELAIQCLLDMARPKSTAAMDHIVASLKNNRSASYADIKAAADKKRIKGVYPIMYGRAQAMLGIVKSAKRGQGKFARASAAKRAGVLLPAVKRGPGRPRKNPLPAANGVAFDSILNAVKNSQADLGRYRGALERIGTLISEALA